jgi:hypothetical protein
VQWTFFAWLFVTLGVAAVLFFTPRVIAPDPPKPITNRTPALNDTIQVTSLIAVLNERAEAIRIDLDRVIEKIVSLHKEDAASQLKELKARFLVLQERHVAAIRASDAIMSHEID